MTDDSPKPKRKRQRWIITGSLLFLMAAAGWWVWPGTDAGYVGSWESADGSERFRLNSDGTMTTLMGSFYWWIRGDQMFELRTGATSSIWRFRDLLVGKLFGKTTSTSALIRFVVKEKSDAAMTVLAPDQKSYQYRRAAQ